MSIKIKHIEKYFGKTRVLHNINLEANKGEILGLIGPSGAGKTTLIRIIISALKESKGEVYFDNIKIPNSELLAKIGFMPQSDALYLDLSALDNLKFFASLYGLKAKKLNERCNEILEFMDLQDYKNKLVADFSGGMRKRLSLAISLVHEPDYLILDEPTVGIDPALRKKIWDNFKHLSASGKTLIISTHIMDEAEKCDKCALIKNGELLAWDKVANLQAKTSDHKLETLFLQEA